MELGNGGDHSAEMQSALKKFEEVCNSLEDEHAKLMELEKRRQKLNEDLQRLKNEITEEQSYFRSMLDGGESAEESSDCVINNPIMEPLAEVDTGPIKEFIQTQRDELAFDNNQVTACSDEDVSDGISPRNRECTAERDEVK